MDFLALPCYPAAMLKGLYRTQDRLLGDCARVHPAAGDAAPVLGRTLYGELGGTPEFSALPTRAEYGARLSSLTLDPLEIG